MGSATEHLRECIERASADPKAIEGALLARRDEAALAEAAAVDTTLPLAGEVLTVKACFDVAGWTTHAGSVVGRARNPWALSRPRRPL